MQESTSPGRVPREALHVQHERLTTKHIQTLSFLQDIANENKELKARVEQLELIQKEYEGLHQMTETSQDRIKQIQAEYIKRADDINAMLAEKHKTEILQMADEKLEIEKNAHQQISSIKLEMEVLQQNGHDLSHRLESLTHADEERETLREELQMLQKDHKLLKSEHTKLQQVSNSKADMHQVQGVKAKNEALEEHIKELVQKKDELEHKISKLEHDLKERSSDVEKIILIENLHSKLEKLHNEKTSHLQQLSDFETDVQNLEKQNEILKGSLINLEKGKEAMALEFNQCFYELQTLKKQYSQDRSRGTFKDFVSIKRELNILKDENEFLRQRGRGTFEKLPFLKYERPPSETKKKTSSAKETSKRKQLSIESSVSYHI